MFKIPQSTLYWLVLVGFVPFVDFSYAMTSPSSWLQRRTSDHGIREHDDGQMDNDSYFLPVFPCVFPKWWSPKTGLSPSSIPKWIFHEMNHPAIKGYPHDELESPKSSGSPVMLRCGSADPCERRDRKGLPGDRHGRPQGVTK